MLKKPECPECGREMVRLACVDETWILACPACAPIVTSWRRSRWLQGIQDSSNGEIRLNGRK